MWSAIFHYNGNKTKIQCSKDEKMEEICKNFTNKIQVDISKLIFLYKGNSLKKELTLEATINEADRDTNEMNILTYNINEANTNDNFHKSKSIICPECKEDIFIKFNSYAISLSDCKNGHSKKNIPIENFENIQVIDYSKIICNQCNKNRQESYQYCFFKCLDCRINLCTLCKNLHEKNEKSHKIIDYDKINYTCNNHNDIFIKYCHDCKKNLCLKCEKDHKNHKCIYFGDILPDDNDIINSNKKLKEALDKLSIDIQLIIDRLNDIINKLKKYQDKFNNIIVSYNNNCKNYQVLQNINEFMKQNNIITKDLNDIISNANVPVKLKNLMNLYYKFNNEIESVDNIKNQEKENININEIKEEKNNTKKYVFDYNKYKQENGEYYPPIVIDNGSTYLRFGISGENYPEVVIPNCIGFPKLENKKSLGKEYLVGKDAEDLREFLNLKYPIQRGIVQNFDEFEKMYDYIFKNEMIVDPTKHNILITGSCSDLMNKKRIAQTMFETFNVPGLAFLNQARASLYAYGKLDGFIIDLSDSLTHLIPYIDDICIKDKESWYFIGGKDLTDYMQKLLKKDGRQNVNYFDAKLIKEKACYCPLDYYEEYKYGPEVYNYKLPDSTIIVKDERIQCPEALFNPNFLNKEEKGLAQTCYDLLLDILYSYNNFFWDKIYLTGGNSLIKGFPEKLEKEIKFLANENLSEKIKIEALDNRLNLPFIGSSIKATTSSFRDEFITREEYDESGEDIIGRRDID